MKTTLGTVFTRLMWGGNVLSAFECFVLKRLVAELPPALREIVEAQFESYNLVQREIDGRALNFYRKVRGRLSMDGVPLMQMQVDVAPLIRLALTVAGTEIHAVLTAVRNRAFSVTFDQDARSFRGVTAVEVTRVTQAWRSNLRCPVGPNRGPLDADVRPSWLNSSDMERFGEP